MQRVKNNGSFLQAYALYSVLKNISRQNIEFLDFNNELLLQKQKNKKSGIKDILRKIKHKVLPKYWSYVRTVKRSERFCAEWQTWLPIIGVDPKKYNYPNGNYDLVVVGSDEVFNVCQFTNEGFNPPWALLGEGINTQRLVSYAAACGQTDLQGLEAGQLTATYGALLNKFDEISVRDENTFNVVSALSDVKPQYHIDPVLLLDEFPEDVKYKRLPYKYVLIYAYTRRIGDEKEIAAIKRFAKSHNLKTVCVNCFQTWADKFIVSSAFALLQYVRDAECVITDTFHGTVFSIRNNVPFVTITRKSNENKLKFLLKQFELSDRELKDVNDLPKIFDKAIDFDAVNEKLACERKKSTVYLKRQIEITEKSENE